MKNIAYIGIGSNLGNKINYCHDAIVGISAYKGNIISKQSSLYRTEPWGNKDQGWFVNCVVKIETLLPAPALLKFLNGIEVKFKREIGRRWSPRTVDLDILFFNDEVIESPEIQIPHPLIQERRFVLVPLEEICPELIHPVLKEPIRVLLEKTMDQKDVMRVEKED